MRRRFSDFMLTACIIVAAPANAFQGSSSLRSFSQSQRAWIPERHYAVPPMAFAIFCRTYRDECHSDGQPVIVGVSAELWAELENVNALVNRRIQSDAGSTGAKAWSLNTTFGDCNDYAVQKRHELLQRGWPMSALSLAVVTTGSGIGHLVLTVRTTDGDYVLDNLRSSIVTWDRTGYRFIQRQALTQARFWVDVSATANDESVQRPNVKVVYGWKPQQSFTVAQSDLPKTKSSQ